MDKQQLKERLAAIDSPGARKMSNWRAPSLAQAPKGQGVTPDGMTQAQVNNFKKNAKKNAARFAGAMQSLATLPQNKIEPLGR